MCDRSAIRDHELYEALRRRINGLLQGETIPTCLAALLGNVIDVARMATIPVQPPDEAKGMLIDMISEMIDAQTEHGQWTIDETAGEA